MDSTNVILQAMAEICAFEIVVGANGKVWIKSADLKSMTLLIAIIKHCDGLHSSAVQSYLATIIKKYKN
jgi:exosome complex RNA-binding protein Rrp4